MEWTHLLAFNLTLLAALASPGPALLFALRQSITGGFGTGLATGLGLAIMAATWTAAALLGLDVVFRLFPWAYVALKTIGAAYLLWIAYTIWRDARQPLTEGQARKGKALWGGVMVNLSNPKSVLFAGSVLVVIFPADMSLVDKALIVANHAVVEIIVYAGFAAFLSTQTARAGYLRLKPIFDRVAAGVLGLLGLRLLLSK